MQPNHSPMTKRPWTQFPLWALIVVVVEFGEANARGPDTPLGRRAASQSCAGANLVYVQCLVQPIAIGGIVQRYWASEVTLTQS